MIKIMTDAAADIDQQTAKELEIEVLPFIINLDGESIVADVHLTPDAFYDKVRAAAEIPTTSQMSPEDVEAVYRRLCSGGNSVIHIAMSANGSGIYNTSCMVAQMLQEEGLDITVIDSAMFAFAIGRAAVQAARMAKAGKSKEEIIAYVTGVYDRDTAYFVVDDLTYLKKGGRIKATTMAVSALLDIKPILMIKDGLVEAYQKVRGLKKAMAILCGYAEERMDMSGESEVILLHSDAEDKVAVLKAMVEERVKPDKITVVKIGPIITAHAGLGLVGIYFKHKESYKNYVS